MNEIDQYIDAVVDYIVNLGCPLEESSTWISGIADWIQAEASHFGTQRATPASIRTAIAEHRQTELPGLLARARQEYVVQRPATTGTTIIDTIQDRLTAAAHTSVAVPQLVAQTLFSQQDAETARDGLFALLEGFLQGARAPIGEIDEARLAEIARENDLVGAGTPFGVLWGFAEEIVETGETLHSLYRVLSDGVPPEVLQAINTIIRRLGEGDVVAVAHEVGIELGQSSGREIANDVSLMYRHVPNDPIWASLWPQVVVGRLVAPIVVVALEIALTLATGGAGVAAVLFRGTRVGAAVMRLARRIASTIPIPSSPAARRRMRQFLNHQQRGRNRSNSQQPSPSPDNGNPGGNRGTDRSSAAQQAEDGAPPTSNPRQQEANADDTVSSDGSGVAESRRRPRRIRRVVVPAPQRVDPVIRGARTEPYDKLTMTTANRGQSLPEDVPRITEIGAVRLRSHDDAVEFRIVGQPGRSIRSQGRLAPRYNTDAAQRRHIPQRALRQRSARHITRIENGQHVAFIRGYHRAHLFGQGWGDEAVDGIMFAPAQLNIRWQTLWRRIGDGHGIERTVDDLAEFARRRGGRLEVIATARSFGRTQMRGMRNRELLLKSVQYEVRLNIPGTTRGPERVFRIEIEVDPPRRRQGGDYAAGTVHQPVVERGRAYGLVFSDIPSNY